MGGLFIPPERCPCPWAPGEVAVRGSNFGSCCRFELAIWVWCPNPLGHENEVKIMFWIFLYLTYLCVCMYELVVNYNVCSVYLFCMCVCICVCVRIWLRMWVSVCVFVRMWLNVCLFMRESASMYQCVCADAWVIVITVMVYERFSVNIHVL